MKINPRFENKLPEFYLLFKSQQEPGLSCSGVTEPEPGDWCGDSWTHGNLHLITIWSLTPHKCSHLSLVETHCTRLPLVKRLPQSGRYIQSDPVRLSSGFIASCRNIHRRMWRDNIWILPQRRSENGDSVLFLTFLLLFRSAQYFHS